MNIEDAIVIEWTCDGSSEDLCTDEHDPALYSYSHKGVVHLVEANKKTPIGRCSMDYFDMENALENGVNTFDVCDGHSESLSEYFSDIFDDEYGHYSAEVENLIGGPPIYLDLIVLDKVVIFPEYRMNGYGLIVLTKMMERAGDGAGVFVLKPYPLQLAYPPFGEHKKDEDWEKLKLGRFDLTSEVATNKLKDYYRSVGFEELSGTPFMVMSGDAATLN